MNTFKFNTFFLIYGFLFDLEIIFLFINFFLLHIIWGLSSIFFDYIHKKKLSFFLFSLLKVLIIENLIQILLLFF